LTSGVTPKRTLEKMTIGNVLNPVRDELRDDQIGSIRINSHELGKCRGSRNAAMKTIIAAPQDSHPVLSSCHNSPLAFVLVIN